MARSLADLGSEDLTAGTTVVVGDPTYLGPAPRPGWWPTRWTSTGSSCSHPTDPQLEAMGLPLITTPAAPTGSRLGATVPWPALPTG